MTDHKGEKNPMFGRKHSEETRRKISEARKGKRKKYQAGSPAGGCRMLLAAIARQAAKDGALWFLESERGRGYCAMAGIDPATLDRIKGTGGQKQ